ncbi:MAG: hypothetical protein JSU07_13425 [Bacteroidetes bacterium]|nr:hypothetical protein [Bacteroidota bacterium]
MGFKSIAQNDKLEQLRVTFINKKLSLSISEADKFWPVYNEYQDKIKTIRKNLRIAHRKNVEVISDSELEELYKLDIKSKQAEADIHKQYIEQIKAIIGLKKTVKLRIAEDEFKKEIIKNIQEKTD